MHLVGSESDEVADYSELCLRSFGSDSERVGPGSEIARRLELPPSCTNKVACWVDGDRDEDGCCG